MAVNSAEELHELIANLGRQFRDAHHPAAHQLWSHADQHIEHVVQNGGAWITREISALHAEWQHHKVGIQSAEMWFEHHAGELTTLSAAPISLSLRVFTGPLGRIAAGTSAVLGGTWGTILGTPGIPLSILGVFRASKNNRLISFADNMAASGKHIDKFFAKRGVTELDKFSKGGGKAVMGLGLVIGGFKVAGDLSTYKTQVASGDVGGAAMSVTDIVATGLKSYPNPVTYASGVAISIVSDDIKAAVDAMNNRVLVPDVTAASMHDVYIPGAIEGFKTGLKEVWEAF